MSLLQEIGKSIFNFSTGLFRETADQADLLHQARRSDKSMIKTTVSNGHIHVKAPNAWPDGTEVLVEVTPVAADKIGIDESEWRDDPEALADWDAWIQTLEPLELTPDEETAFARFNAEMKRLNVEAVRKQMEEGASP